MQSSHIVFCCCQLEGLLITMIIWTLRATYQACTLFVQLSATWFIPRMHLIPLNMCCIIILLSQIRNWKKLEKHWVSYSSHTAYTFGTKLQTHECKLEFIPLYKVPPKSFISVILYALQPKSSSMTPKTWITSPIQLPTLERNLEESEENRIEFHGWIREF